MGSKKLTNKQYRLFSQQLKIFQYGEYYNKFKDDYFFGRYAHSSSLSNIININKSIKLSKLRGSQLDILIKSNVHFLNNFSTTHKQSDKMIKAYTIANLAIELHTYLKQKYESDNEQYDDSLSEIVAQDIINAFKDEQIKLTPLQLEQVLSKMDISELSKDHVRFSLLEHWNTINKLRK